MSSGFYSDTQTFNRGYLREKIEDGSLGLPALTPGGWRARLTLLLLDDMSALMPWMVNLYS